MLHISSHQLVLKDLIWQHQMWRLYTKILCCVYETGDRGCLGHYSEIALRRVWNVARFSWWMTNMLHEFGDAQGDSVLDLQMHNRFMTSELRYVLQLEAGRKLIAEQYVGLPYEDLQS